MNKTIDLTEFTRQLITCTGCEYSPRHMEDGDEVVPYLIYHFDFPKGWEISRGDTDNEVIAIVNLAE